MKKVTAIEMRNVEGGASALAVVRIVLGEPCGGTNCSAGNTRHLRLNSLDFNLQALEI